MNTLIVMPHLDDETFSCGGMLLNRKSNASSIHISIPNYDSDQSLNSDLMILTFCKGRRDDPQNQHRMTKFKEFCLSVNANYIILNHYDLELYKNPLNHYIDILQNIFSQYNKYCNKNKSKFEIFTISENDLHQEHRMVSHAVKIACRRYLDSISRILEFKQPFENFDRSEYECCFECPKEKESCCKQYKEQQPLYYDKEFYREIYNNVI